MNKIVSRSVIRSPQIMKQIAMGMIGIICESSRTNCVCVCVCVGVSIYSVREVGQVPREEKYPNNTRRSTFCCSENTASQTSLPFDLRVCGCHGVVDIQVVGRPHASRPGLQILAKSCSLWQVPIVHLTLKGHMLF